MTMAFHLDGGVSQADPVSHLLGREPSHRGLVRVHRRQASHVAGTDGEKNDVGRKRSSSEPGSENFLAKKAVIAFVNLGLDPFAPRKTSINCRSCTVVGPPRIASRKTFSAPLFLTSRDSNLRKAMREE